MTTQQRSTPIKAAGQRDDAPGSSLGLLWSGLYAAHALAVVVGFGTEQLYAATACASAALLAMIHLFARGGWDVSLLLTTAFVAGNVGVFAYVNAIYVKFTSLPQSGFRELTAWLTTLLVWSAVVGCLGTHAMLGREASSPKGAPALRSQWTLGITGTLALLLIVARISTGSLDSRWDIDVGKGFGVYYVAGALGAVGYAVFFVLGAQLRGALLHPRNVVTFVVIGLLGGLEGLGGGREFVMWMFLLLLMGSLWSRLGRSQITLLWVATATLSTLFLFAIGEARSRAGFAFGRVSDRVSVIGDVLEETQGAAGGQDDSFEPLIARLSERSAQIVIGQTAMTGHRAGFEHFERLSHLFVPKVLAPDKKPINDGPEVLARDYGVRITAYTSIPITLLADSYRRGGWLWVMAVGLAAGIALRLITRIVIYLAGRDFGLVCLALLALLFLRSYTFSVLGFIGLITYQTAKLVLVLVTTAAVIKLMAARTGPDSRGNAARTGGLAG